MRTVTELGDLWERQEMARLRKKRNDIASGGEYGAQMLRMVAMHDRMIAAALPIPSDLSIPEPKIDAIEECVDAVNVTDWSGA